MTEEIEEVRRFYSKISGVTSANDDGTQRQDLIRKLRLRTGQKLELVREPRNRYDRNAIAIFCKGRQLGYINSELAESMAEDLAGGLGFRAFVANVTGGTRDAPNYGVNLLIVVTDPSVPLAKNREAAEAFGRSIGEAIVGLASIAFGLVAKIPRTIAGLYKASPEWAVPIWWGVAVTAPFVILIFTYQAMR